jgi:peptide/nickel transport system permease protein
MRLLKKKQNEKKARSQAGAKAGRLGGLLQSLRLSDAGKRGAGRVRYWLLWLRSLRPKQMIGIAILLIYVAIALAAPYLVTHDPWAINRSEAGLVAHLEPPSSRHLLGTTDLGRDIFSQLVTGTRATIIVGFVAAFCVTLIGTNMGLISGYYGGWVDEVIMRLVDIAYIIPFVPFVIILVSLLEPSLWNIILAIVLLFWRSPTRVIRSQVLSLKTRPFVKAARVAGASDLRIVFTQIAPNILPLSLLYMAISVGWAIITEASVSFLGLGDPLVISWGQMLNLAFLSGAVRHAWWWIVPPGISIVLIVVATFLIGEAAEEYANPRLKSGR